MQGAVLAPDRTELLLPVEPRDCVGVWAFTVNKPVTNSLMVFRYDHARAAANKIPETDLKLMMDAGSGWVVLNATLDATSKHLQVQGVALPAGESRFAAVTRSRHPGTAIVIQ